MTAYAAPSGRMQRRRAFFRRLRRYLYAGGFLLLLVGVGYLVIASPLFKISKLTVVADNTVDSEALIAVLKTQVGGQHLGWLGADNYLAWPDDLHYTTPHVKDIVVEKSFWSRSITVTAKARQRYAVWCSLQASDDACYWIDPDGVIFEYAPVAEGQLVQTIFDTATGPSGGIGDLVLPADQFRFVSSIIDGIRKLNLGVGKITVSRPLQEIWLDTDAGARIIASLRFDPVPAAIPAISRFMQKPGFAKIEYVNLTVENRAFVKYK